MLSYRLYMLNHLGHVFDARDFTCDDDSEALGVAKQEAQCRDVELWQGARKVALFQRSELGT
jgi:hypothetical protein